MQVPALCGGSWWWLCLLQLLSAPRGRKHTLSQMGKALQAGGKASTKPLLQCNFQSTTLPVQCTMVPLLPAAAATITTLQRSP